MIPVANGFLHEARAQISGGRLLYELWVSIVLVTAIPEKSARERDIKQLPGG